MILSAGMMLDWLGTPLCSAAAARLRRAVEAVLEDPSARTPDLGGKLTTAQLTRLIVQAVG